MKRKLLLSFVIASLFFSLFYSVNAAPEKAFEYTDVLHNTRVIDTVTDTVPTLQNGQVFVDKSIGYKTMTIDSRNFTAEDYIVELSAIAKECQDSAKPVDMLFVLDVTMSTANASYGNSYDAGGQNGSIDDMVLALNVCMDQILNANADSRVGILAYGGANCFVGSTRLGIGSTPQVLLPLDHYTNSNWTSSQAYTLKNGIGSVDNQTYRGGCVVNGKYITFVESAEDLSNSYDGVSRSTQDYITDMTLRNKTYQAVGFKYTFRVQSNPDVQNVAGDFTQHKVYAGWNGTYTQIAFEAGGKMLYDQTREGSKPMLVLLTDGNANIASKQNSYNYSSTNLGNATFHYAIDDKGGLTEQSVDNADTIVFFGNDINILTVSTATYWKQQLINKYGEASFYTIGMIVDNEPTNAMLGPSLTDGTMTTEDGQRLKSQLQQLYGNGRLTLSDGTVITNVTGTNNYRYSNYYHANNGTELNTVFEDITKQVDLSACGEIVISDTLGNYMELKDVLGVMKDEVYYPVESSSRTAGVTTYAFSNLPDLTLKYDGSEVTCTIPKKYNTSLIRFVFSEGISSSVDFSNQTSVKNLIDNGMYDPTTKKFTFYTNKWSSNGQNATIATFTINANQNSYYNMLPSDVNKATNTTSTYSKVSNVTKTGNNVVVRLGNNAKEQVQVKTKFNLYKTWTDGEFTDLFRPDQVEFKLLQNNTQIATYTLKESENWQVEVDEVDKYDNNGNLYTYSIKEDEIILTPYDKYVPGNTTGCLINNALRRTPSTVVVKYVDRQGTEIATRDILEGYAGEDYTTSRKTIPTYMAYGNDPSNANGTYTDTEQEVIYVYDKIPAQVKVLHVEEGTDVTNPESVTNVLYNTETIDGKVDDAYTTSNKLNEINASHTEQYDFVRSTTNTSGNMTVDTIYVIYEYKKAPAKVKVQHLEQGTNSLLHAEETLNGVVGLDYTTTNKLSEINAENANKYELVTPEPSNKNGTYAREEQTVTYYYQKKPTKVVVLHVEEGTDVTDPASVTDVIYPTEEMTGRVDDTYNTSAKTDEINNESQYKYALTSTPSNANGSMTIDTIYVIYVYQKQDTSLLVKHIDVITRELLDSKTIEGYIGDKVTTQEEAFEHYRLYEKPTTEEYTLTEEPQTVTYYYIRQANVITKYVDENTGREIADEKKDTYDQRSEYNTVKENISGYTFTRDTENTSGTVETQDIYVTYYYKKASSVKAVYIDYYTNEVIAEEENFEGLEGDTYTTEEKEIEGYVFEEVDGDVAGTIAAEPKTITYKYKKLVNVTTKYLDVYTNEPIEQEVSVTYPEKSEYNTPRKTIEGYTFTRDTGNTSGTVDREDVEVIYYYTKKSGVTVKYIDYYTGEEVEATEIINGIQGENYTTEKKEVPNYVFKEVEGDVEGTIPASPITITYKYIKQADVVVEYLDEVTGNYVAPYDRTTYTEREEYTTAPKIVADYTLTTDSGNTAGTVYRDDIFVKYYYKKNTSLVVKYVDYYTGEIISPTITMTGVQGQEYTTEQKEIPDYVYVEVIGKPNGQMDREPQEVIYRYKKQANLITEHIDINTGEKIIPDVIKKYMEKEEYEALGQNFPGYVLVQAPEQTKGIMEREDVTKTFYYKKISGGLIVKYVDVLSGELLDQVEYTGNEGDPVTFEEKSFIYYFLHSTPEVDNATLTVEPQEYIYYYIKMGSVNVIGIDQDTREELYRYNLNGVEGEKYEAYPRTLDGYKLVVIPNNEKGTYERNTPDVIYEYKKYSGTVDVEYIDKDTGELLGTDKMSGVIGESYKTEQRTYEGYRFVNVEGETIGTYSEEAKLVKYYYERKTGRVVVKYITEDGTELAREEDSGKVGESFHFTEKEFEEYEVVSRPDSLDGTYVEGLIELVIVLKPTDVLGEESGTIIVNFKDRQGNVLRQQVISQDLVGEEFYLEAPDIEGYTIVGDRIVKATYINGELVYDIIYEKIEEKPAEPIKETVDTGDINVVAMLIVLAVSACGITLVKKYKKD